MVMDEPHDLLVRCLAAHREWILATAEGRSFALRNDEIDLEAVRGRLLIGFPTDNGFRTWRVDEIAPIGPEIRMRLSRALGRESTRIRLVPRASFSELQSGVEVARLERANRVAESIRRDLPHVRLERVELNRENGRFAQILFGQAGVRRAAIADVSDSLTPEFLLSAACFWLATLERRRKNPARSVAVVAGAKQAKRLAKLHALLRASWRTRVSIFEADDQGSLELLDPAELSGLWTDRVPTVRLPAIVEPTDTARRLIALAPEAIDSVFSRNGETIRYHGLPFARVRRLLGEERCWIGINGNRRPLNDETLRDLEFLLEGLAQYRIHDSPNRQHALYQTAPEAWLEAIIRRDIRRLDANLILSPVYHQFRAERDKIDLLALRRDGRLVIIELKVEPDREMIFQTADYWRKIEHIRRSGRLNEARLFGDLEIADAPAICYLVAPTLSYHRDFDFSASLVTREIEIHRFNLAEDWRRRLRVLERRRAT